MDNENDSNNDIQENSESNHYSKELEPEDANLQVETTTLDVKCEVRMYLYSVTAWKRF